MTEEDARCAGRGRRNGRTPYDIPDGYVSWDEHHRAWASYSKRWSGLTSEEIEARGGFTYDELKEHLGQPPETWRPRDRDRFVNFQLSGDDRPWSQVKVDDPVVSDDVGHIYYVGGNKSLCSDDVVIIEPIYFDEEGKHCGNCLSKLILWIESWTKE